MSSLIERFYVSDSPSTKTFQFDDALPSLPVPDLHKTLEKYLNSLKPFLSEEEFNNTQTLVTDFENGCGQDLQKRLKEHAKGKKNWVEDWWLKYAYLSNRTPLSPHCSMHGMDPNNLSKWPPSEKNAMKYATGSAYSIMKFFDLLRKEKLNPQMSKNGQQLSMDQFRNLFSGVRIPHKGMDEFITYYKPESEGDCPKHYVVLCRGHVWVINPWGTRGQILPMSELEYQLNYVKEQSMSRPPGPGIGALTMDERDTWAKNRDWLLSLSIRNQRNLRLIESAICAFSFIDYSPSSPQECCRDVFTRDPSNRWADKSYTGLTFNNGYIGAMAEHSGYDAMMTVIFSHYSHFALPDMTWETADRLKEGDIPYRLEFDVDSIIRRSIEAAKENYSSEASGVDVQFHVFDSYGKDWIKSQNLHPDAYIQCLLQLTFYKMHKKLAPTYETATIRRFLGGRTETVRSCTPEVADWVRAMESEIIPASEKKKKLSAAARRHVELMSECERGEGIDRHLFGLYLIALEAGLPIPDIFSDPAFFKSGGGGNFQLSTSTLGYTECIGAVAAMVKDGYGIFYSILPDKFYTLITNYKGGDTCVKGFMHTFSESLLKVQEILSIPDARM